MTNRAPALLLTLLLALSFGSAAAAAARAPEEAHAVSSTDERYTYRWELRKLAALLGGILLPGEGGGELTFERTGDGHVISELLVTSEHGRKGEFWRYGAEIDPEQSRTLRAWTSYRWRGEEKSESSEIDETGVIDVASGIYEIRRTLPRRPVRMRIWSDGKIYPVVVTPMGDEHRSLPKRGKVLARHFRVEGREVPGERYWKGHMDLWFARDGKATPIEIHFNRTLVGVRLRLLEGI